MCWIMNLTLPLPIKACKLLIRLRGQEPSSPDYSKSGIIPPEKLPLKYHEIHANEIVLLAYYIAAINIESVYHALLSEHAVNTQENSTDYQPFEGICLTDTFQMYEKEDLIDENFASE